MWSLLVSKYGHAAGGVTVIDPLNQMIKTNVGVHILMYALIIAHYKFHSGLHLLSVPDVVHNEAGLPAAAREDGDHRDGLGVTLHGLTPLHRERGLITNLRECQ